jgi:hypothetical protein
MPLVAAQAGSNTPMIVLSKPDQVEKPEAPQPELPGFWHDGKTQNTTAMTHLVPISLVRTQLLPKPDGHACTNNTCFWC